MLSKEIKIIETETVQVVDNGFTYEVDFLTYQNSEYNVANGGKKITYGAVAFRLKTNGQRGLQLKGLNKRISDIANLARQSRPQSSLKETDGL